MKKCCSTLAVARTLALTLACASQTAWADPVAQMRQCRLLNDVALKAACYDAIVLPPVGSVAPTAAPLATPAAAVAAFGLPAAPPLPAQKDTVVADALESSIVGLFEGWQPQSRIRLANGQVWQVTDGSEGQYTRRDPKVRIIRGTLGSFFMQIDGIAQTPRVRRIP